MCEGPVAGIGAEMETRHGVKSQMGRGVKCSVTSSSEPWYR
jgi:hypothetical protein